MSNYGIPKEIKAKPKLMGFELKELAFIGVVVALSLTMLPDMVHKIFVIPFYIIVGLSLFYLFSPSSTNPNRKNYHSLIYFYKKDRNKYHSIDKHAFDNELALEKVLKKNQLLEKQHVNEEKVKTEVFDLYDKKDVVMLEKDEKDYVPSFDSKEAMYKDYEVQLDDEETLDEEEPTTKLSVPKNKKEEENLVVPLSHEEMIEEFDEARSKFRRQELNRKNVQSQKGKKEGMRIDKKLMAWSGVAAILLAVGVILFTFYFSQSNIVEENESPEIAVDDSENVVSALRSFSLKNYDEAMEYFDDVEYGSLGDDDKDVMLLSYLFGGKPEKALELEPSFDETVVSYYKATHSMQNIIDLAEIVDSKVLEFEIAVNDKDYEKIIELKDFVKQKDEREEIIVQAMLELGEIDEAKVFAFDVGNEDLIAVVDLYEEVQKEKKRKEKRERK